MNGPQSQETLRQFLQRRERELTQQIGALQSLIAGKDRELAEIRQATAALPPLGLIDPTTLGIDAQLASPELAHSQGALDLSRYESMTIKELVIRALHDGSQRATTADLREFIKNAYGRKIDPSSLRPQLSRLKAEGSIEWDVDADAWQLTTQGRLMAIGHLPANARILPQDFPAEGFAVFIDDALLVSNEASDRAAKRAQDTRSSDSKKATAPPFRRRV